MLLEEIARTSANGPDEVPVAAAYLSGTLPQGTIGVGWASLRDLPPPATSATLQLFEVHAALEWIRTPSGKDHRQRGAASCPIFSPGQPNSRKGF